MGTFNSTKFVPTAMTDFQPVIQRAKEYYTSSGSEFVDNSGALGDGFSISKGGMFKAVLGMKTALNVEFKPISGGVNLSATVGIFGEQAIPTLISMFVLWPVLVTQITGLVQQAKLDDEVLTFVESSIRQLEGGAPGSGGGGGFCTGCGQPLPAGARFCPACGAKVSG